MSFIDGIALPLSLSSAFLLGFGARQLGLPPLVGFLVAGFVLNLAGVRADASIQAIADFGVMLLLFTIGLKLRIQELAAPPIWAGATAHSGISVLALTLVLGLTGALLGDGLNLVTAALLAFALSFSSTVFTVKIFEERGELGSRFAKTAIGILVMQDLFAVAFLTASTGELPSLWALALVGFFVVRPLLFALLDRCGHGELLPLFGLFAAIGLGVSIFELVGLKPDLGALALGMLLASHPRAGDVVYQLFGFKEILLVGFFLSIGLAGLPSLAQLVFAALLLLLLPIKAFLFFWLLTRLGVSVRAAFLTALGLATYSEFGLIVAGLAVDEGWLAADWLSTIAVAVALSFVVAAPLNALNNQLYERLKAPLKRFDRTAVDDGDVLEDAGPARIAVVGMGRVGTSTYDRLRMDRGDIVLGIDADPTVVEAHRGDGRRVLLGDVTDVEWWERLQRIASERRARGMTRLEALVLALPAREPNLYVLEKMRQFGFDGLIVAIAYNEDDAVALRAAGAHYAFEAHAEAGIGLASHIKENLPPG